MIGLDTILIVVVLYKCRFEDAKSIETLSKSLEGICDIKMELVVYDNSPQYNSYTLYSPLFNIHYVPDFSNSGVSKAYNTAYSIGKKMGKKYLLLLDQDTKFPLTYCRDLTIIEDKYSLVMPKLEAKDVIISPCYYRLGRGFPMNDKKCVVGESSLKGRNFLNSGALISISLYEAVGGFDERVPLYFSDFNFFNRAKQHISSYYQMNTLLHHDMSSNDETNLEQFVGRFKLYCDGAFVCYHNLGGIILMCINVFLRAIKVGIKFRTFQFIEIALKSFYHVFFK